MLRAYKRENPTGAMIGIQTVTIAVAGRHIQVGCNRRAEVDWDVTFCGLGITYVALAERVTRIRASSVRAPFNAYDPSSVVAEFSAPVVGCPLASQLQNRAASPHETSLTGKFPLALA